MDGVHRTTEWRRRKRDELLCNCEYHTPASEESNDTCTCVYHAGQPQREYNYCCEYHPVTASDDGNTSSDDSDVSVPPQNIELKWLVKINL